MNNFKTLAIIW